MYQMLPDEGRPSPAVPGINAPFASFVRAVKAHGVPLAFLACVHIAAFARSLFQDKFGHFFGYTLGDFDNSYHHVLIFISDTLRAGALPIWDPYMAAGLPNYLNPQSLMWWPVTWLGTWLFGYTHAVVQRQLFLTLLVGGVGAYGLTAYLWRSRVAALCAAISFSLSNGLFGNLEHLDIINAYAHLPWLIWGAILLSKPGRAGPIMLPLVIFSFIVSSYPAVVAMGFLWVGAWHLYTLASQPTWKSRGRYAGRVVLAWALGLGMACVHWLPVMLHLKDVGRGAALDMHAVFFGSIRLAQMWSVVYNFMSGVDVPGRSTDPSMRGVYGGVVMLPFMLLACRVLRGKYFTGACILMVGAGLMAVGNAFFGRVALHILVPLFNFSRFPSADSRALFVLGMALVSSAGLAAFAKDPDQHRSFVLRCYGVLAIFLVASIGALKGILVDVDANRYDDIVLAGITMQLVCIGAAWILISRTQMRVAGLALILALDMGTTVNLNYDSVIGFALSPEAGELRKKTEHGFPLELAEQDRIYRPQKITMLESFSSHTQKNFYLNYYGGFTLNSFHRLIDTGFADWMAHGKRVMGLQHPDAVHTAQEFTQSLTPVDYAIQRYLPDRVDYKITVSEPTTLVFNEMYFDGWWATVDGVQQKMFSVVDGLRAIRVEPGVHDVRTVFRPRTLNWAIAGSAASLMLWAIWLSRHRSVAAICEHSEDWRGR